MTRLREMPNFRELERRLILGELEKRAHYCCEKNLCFLMLSCLIFESSVDRGIPSFAAAPPGPATFPLHSANAVSIISFS